MPAITLSNLIAYSTQVACVVAAAAALPAILRMHVADVRYAYWRVMVLLCLALPWIQRPHAVDAARATDVTRSTLIPLWPALAVPDAATSAESFDWGTSIGLVIVGGLVLRLMWIAVGLLHLGRLRRTGYPAPAAQELDEMQRLIGTRAEIRYVPGLCQPVTFGVFRPVVLMPDSVRDRVPDLQRAVLAHELFHVKRRDWAWILAEELVRAAFWFHPAMWWLISRVQLAREEVVDELSVLATGHRRTYAEALLAFADSTPLDPAPAFARRRHLFRRMVLISSEVVMSSKRVVASCVVMGCVVAAASFVTIGAFPLAQTSGSSTVAQSGPGPVERRAKPITPENPVPRRVSSAEAIYPAEAAAVQARGDVTLQVTIDEFGRVAEARPTGVSAISDGPTPFNVGISGIKAWNLPSLMERVSLKAGPTGAPDVRPVLEAFSRSAIEAVRQWQYDPPAEGPISFPIVFTFKSSERPAGAPGDRSADAPGQVGRTSYGDVARTSDGALLVGGAITPPRKLTHVAPVYPEDAKAANVSGVVIIEARVEGDGHVSSARVVKSIELLDQAAIDAVKQWMFTPTLVNGTPTPVVLTVTINFRLP